VCVTSHTHMVRHESPVSASNAHEVDIPYMGHQAGRALAGRRSPTTHSNGPRHRSARQSPRGRRSGTSGAISIHNAAGGLAHRGRVAGRSAGVPRRGDGLGQRVVGAAAAVGVGVAGCCDRRAGRRGVLRQEDLAFLRRRGSGHRPRASCIRSHAGREYSPSWQQVRLFIGAGAVRFRLRSWPGVCSHSVHGRILGNPTGPANNVGVRHGMESGRRDGPRMVPTAAGHHPACRPPRGSAAGWAEQRRLPR
jgi:hypothetical protein